MMYDIDDLVPISALQHFAFCERQWALIHLECVWEENPLTAEGRILHERADEYTVENRRDIRIVRSLGLRSLRLGVTGKADVVEFHLLKGDDASKGKKTEGDGADYAGTTGGVILAGASGLWRPYPVEYKRGKPKIGSWDDIQLCAQAMCLEEMLGAVVDEGALFYGEPKRRKEVRFDEALRNETERIAMRVHESVRRGTTPSAEYSHRCERCSLIDSCLPKTAVKRGRVGAYLMHACEHPEEREKGEG